MCTRVGGGGAVEEMREARLYPTAETDAAETRRASSPGPHVWVDLRALDFAWGDHLLPRDAPDRRRRR